MGTPNNATDTNNPVSITYLEKDGQDQLCNLAYLTTLDLLVAQNKLTADEAKALSEQWTLITINKNSFIDKIAKLLGLVDNRIKVKAISIP